MSKRSAQFVAALTVSVLAGANLATVTDLRAQAATADDCLTAPKGRDHAGQPLVLSHRSRDQASMLVPSRRARQGQIDLRHPAGEFASSRRAGDAAAAHDHAEGDFRGARGMGLATVPRRTDRSRLSRAANDRRRARQASWLRMPSAPSAANVLAPAPATTSRWLDNNQSANSAGNPADVQTAATVAEPAGDQQQAAEQPPCSRRCNRSPHRDLVRRCGLVDGKAYGIVADAAWGDACRAGAGRHHGEPPVQAWPHPRAARHATSAARTVGCRKKQSQAFGAAGAFSTAETYRTADTHSTADTCSAAGTSSAADASSATGASRAADVPARARGSSDRASRVHVRSAPAGHAGAPG